MKNKIILALSVISLAFSSNCSEKKSQPEISNNLSNLPSWVLDPEFGEGVAAVGIANPSKGGLKFQISQAEINARSNIASIVESKISKITKNALRSANVNGNDDVEDFFSEATKEVVENLPISGVKRVKDHIFQDKDGTLYIHMVLTKEDYSKFLQKSEKNLTTSLKKSQLSRENINQSELASKAIFDELEKERANKKSE